MKISNLITNENTEEEDFPSCTKNYFESFGKRVSFRVEFSISINK